MSSSSISVGRRSLTSFTYSDSSSSYVSICPILLSIEYRSSPFYSPLSPWRTRVPFLAPVFSLLLRSRLRSRSTDSPCLPEYHTPWSTSEILRISTCLSVSDSRHFFSVIVHSPTSFSIIVHSPTSILLYEIVFLHYSPSLWHRKIKQGSKLHLYKIIYLYEYNLISMPY